MELGRSALFQKMDERPLTELFESRFDYIGNYRFARWNFVLKILLESSLQSNHYLILDAGCGYNSIFFEISGDFRGVGIDLNRGNVLEALKRSKDLGLNECTFLVGCIEKLPFRDESFDIVFSRNVLEHVKDQERVIGQLVTCLKGGGKMVLTTTNELSIPFIIDRLVPQRLTDVISRIFGYFYYERTHRLNPWSLRHILSKKGVYIEYFLLFPSPPFYRRNTRYPKPLLYMWTIYDAITNLTPLKSLKEMMLLLGVRTSLVSCHQG